MSVKTSAQNLDHDFNRSNIEIENGKVDKEFVNSNIKKLNNDTLTETLPENSEYKIYNHRFQKKNFQTSPDDILTLNDLWMKSLMMYKNEVLCAFRDYYFDPKENEIIFDKKYTTITYGQFETILMQLSYGFKKTFKFLKAGSKIAIWGKNSPGYLACEHVAFANSLIVSPLYDAMSIEFVQHCLLQLQPEIFIFGREKIDRLLSIFSSAESIEKYGIKAFVMLDDIEYERKYVTSSHINSFDAIMPEATLFTDIITLSEDYIKDKIEISDDSKSKIKNKVKTNNKNLKKTQKKLTEEKRRDLQQALQIFKICNIIDKSVTYKEFIKSDEIITLSKEIDKGLSICDNVVSITNEEKVSSNNQNGDKNFTEISMQSVSEQDIENEESENYKKTPNNEQNEVSTITLPEKNSNGDDSIKNEVTKYDYKVDEDIAKDCEKFPPPQKDTVAFIFWTSGTNAWPKGCVMTHYAFVQAVYGWISTPLPTIQTAEGCRYLCILPLSHVFSRTIVSVAMVNCASLYFWSGSMKYLQDDIQLAKPHAFIAVPRVFIAIKNEILKIVNEMGKYKQKLFYAALSNAKKNYPLQPSYWAKRILKPVRDVLGGNAIYMICGGAYLPESVQEFIRVAFSTLFFVGYGSTETNAVVTVQTETDLTIGNCGVVTPNVEIAIVKNKDNDLVNNPYSICSTNDKIGEIYIRGSSLMSGYYNSNTDFTKNKGVVQSSKTMYWFKSGDLGYMNDSGKLVLTDRIIGCSFKLENGEFCNPELTESTYQQSEFVENVFVPYVKADFLIAIVVPKAKIMRESLGEGEISEIILNDFKKIHKQCKLPPYMLIKRIYIESEIFTVDNGSLTPTLKLRRKNLQRKYSDVIRRFLESADQCTN